MQILNRIRDTMYFLCYYNVSVTHTRTSVLILLLLLLLKYNEQTQWGKDMSYEIVRRTTPKAPEHCKS